MPIRALVFDAYGTLYDVQSVADATEAAFPGHGATITQLWRLKQLEYSWLRSMMGRYADFATATREALRYTLDALGLAADAARLDALVAAYDRLAPYPEAAAALDALAGRQRAILSNGSPAQLAALVCHSGFEGRLEAVLSVDRARAFKPDPRAYALVEPALGVARDEILFVSSNGFDVAGAKSFGFRVARIARVAPAALRASLAAGPIDPARMFQALRSQTEALGFAPDHEIGSLTDLRDIVAAG